MRLYFWQHVLSPHQSDFLFELSKIDNNEIFWIVENKQIEYRTRMGWEEVNTSNLNIIVSPTKIEVQNILFESKYYNSVHIFSGTRGVELVRFAFKLACKLNLRIAIQSESIDKKGVKGLFRIIFGLIDKKCYSQSISYVFAIGSLGRQWFEFLGYDHKKIFDWGYFPNPDFVKIDDVKFNQEKFNFIYCGSLLKGKGVFDLLLAYYNVCKNNQLTHLHIVGDGNEFEKMRILVDKYKIFNNVTFHGVLLNKHAKYLISISDVLILPSIIKDGWGAVVNEAILNGTRVICSDMCGSSILIKNNYYFGSVFEFSNTKGLIENMNQLIHEGKFNEFKRRNLIHQSLNKLSPKVATNYFNSVINGKKNSKAPWLI